MHSVSPLYSGLLILPLAAFSAGAQDDVGGGGDGLPMLEEVEARVAEIRGLEFTQKVPAEKQSAEDFKAYLQQEMEQAFPADSFNDIMDGLLRLGLMTEPIDLGESFVSALASQAAAYYDPSTGTFFYLMTDMPMTMLEPIAAHELVHALQDQHLGLSEWQEEMMADMESSLDLNTPRNDDEVLAARFLIEGEATYVMNIYQAGPQMGDAMSKQMAKMPLEQIVAMTKQMAKMQGGDEADDLMKSIESMDDIPAYILEPLIAAYMQGAGFCAEVKGSGEGWEALNAAWKDLPASSEQAMHPEKYFGENRDVPTVINLPEFSMLEEQGWKPIDSAIHGEFYLRLLLRTQGVATGKAAGASEGWDGDVYRAYRNDDGEIGIALATTWDTEKDAQQFFTAYRAAIDHKYPDLQIEAEEDGSVQFTCGGDATGQGAVVLRGTEVFAAEGFAAVAVEAVIDDMIDMPIERIGTIEHAAKPTDKLATRIAFEGFSFRPHAMWTEEDPENDRRAAQFVVPAATGEERETQLVIFHFASGPGGGEDMVDANFDRWRDQFDSDTDGERRLRNQHGLRVHEYDISGTYIAEKGFGTGEFFDEPGYRMLAAIVVTDAGNYYFKIIGPKATVTKWRGAWDAVMSSIEPSM